MKWRLYNAPEFVKFMISDLGMESGNDKGSPYKKFEYSMYVFTDWIGRRLDDIYKKEKKFVPGQSYNLYMNEKDDIETIKEFAQFYIRARRDPLSGKCAYKEKIEAVNDSWEINPNLKLEYFTFLNKPPKFDNVNMVAFIITAVNVKPLSSDQKVDARVTIQCIAYE